MRLLLTVVFFPVHILHWWAAHWRCLRDWYYRTRPPPWMDIGSVDPLQGSEDGAAVEGEHNISFASRHHIAECGLLCPQCGKLAARRGDFRGVRRTRLGEAVVCAECGETLVASPDTEHGDDLLPYDPKTMERFVRISPQQALREQWGDDMKLHADGSIAAKRHSVSSINQDPTHGAIPWSEVSDHSEE